MKTKFSFRLYSVGLLFTAIGVAIIAQMWKVQHNEVVQSIKEQSELYYSFKEQRIYPERGNIYDRWGHLLAGNQNVYEVGVELISLRRYDQDGNAVVSKVAAATIAETLYEVLGEAYLKMSADEIYEKLIIPYQEGEYVYLVLNSFVPLEKVEELAEIKSNYEANYNSRAKEEMPNLGGLVWKPHLQRSYPEGTLASNVLGFYRFYDRENAEGFYGVEEQYDDILSGVPVNVLMAVDPNSNYKPVEVPNGDSLVLTLDREIQATVERIIDESIETYQAESALAIVMDPLSGEILAMATTDRIDLNEYWDFEWEKPEEGAEDEAMLDETPFNPAVAQAYEPGSVFKVLTMATALDIDAVEPDTKFNDPGRFDYGGIYIYNWNRKPWGEQTMLGCMQHSLNVCLAWVATEKIGQANFYEYIQAFGIGKKTNVDLADEASFPLRVPGMSGWYPSYLATNSFGQGLAVTPLQMITAISAVPNGGKIMAPHILKAVIRDGRQYNNSPQVIATPIKAETAEVLNEMLAESIAAETTLAQVNGYRVAGKTGTAQIPDEEKGYLEDLTNASFVGWGPVDDPRFIVYVWVKKPGTSIWGSEVAAPVFQEIFQYLVVHAGLPPDELRQQLYSQK